MNNATATPRRQFTPEDLVRVFRAVSETGAACVLMGGQASNFWSRRFAQNDPGLAAIRNHYGFTSKDVDFQGDRNAATLLASALQAALKPVREREAFGNLLAGQFAIALDGDQLKVEVLRKVPGLTPAEVAGMTVIASIGGVNIPLLNPVAALMAKAWNVARIRKEGRHDAEQLLALVCATRVYFRELFEVAQTPADLRQALKLLERFLRFAELPIARAAAETCGVNWSWALPHRYLAADRRPAVVNLRTRRLPTWLARIRKLRRGVPATVEVIRILALLTEHAEAECVPQPAVERAERYLLPARKRRSAP